MRKKQNRIVTTIFIVLGIGLMITAGILVLISQLSGRAGTVQAAKITETLYELMPESSIGVPDDRVNRSMASIELDGVDFAGVLEVPDFRRELPVGSQWNPASLTGYPCRYAGSMHDNSLVIGGSDNEGQFDFMKEIGNGDVIWMTDVTGLRYRYFVTMIRRAEDLSAAIEKAQEADLILFTKNSYNFDYTVVLCMLKGT